MELERIALEDEYFVSRKLYPNVDFYSGIIYQAMGFPVEMFPVLFAIPRVAGWLAQWQEMLEDDEQKIARPRQVYVGARPARLPGDGAAGQGREGDGPAADPRARRTTRPARRGLSPPRRAAFRAAARAGPPASGRGRGRPRRPPRRG